MPSEFAIRRCWPGSSGLAVVQTAFRVIVAPDDATYTTSIPARSTGTLAAFVISVYSSEAEVPPVTTSASNTLEEGGHATSAASDGCRGAGPGDKTIADAA